MSDAARVAPFFRRDATAAEVLAAARALPDVADAIVDSAIVFRAGDVRPDPRGPRGVDGVARVETPAGLLHPALAEAVAGCLGIDVDTVFRIAFFEAAWTPSGDIEPIADLDALDLLDEGEIAQADSRLAGGGPEALRARLGSIARGSVPGWLCDGGYEAADLILTAVPVVPAAERPLAHSVDGAGLPGICDARYQDLVAAANDLARTAEYPGAGVVRARLHRELQTRFEALWLQLSRGPEESPAVLPSRRRGVFHRSDDRFLHPASPPPPIGLFVPDASDAPPDDLVSGPPASAVAFAGEHFLVAVCDDVIARVDVRDGSVTRVPAPADASFLLACGMHAVFTRYGQPAVLELAGLTWLSAPPEDLAVVEIVSEDDATRLVDARRGVSARLHEVIEGRGRQALSPDARHVWVEDALGAGGIWEVASGLLQLDARRLPAAPTSCPLLLRSGERVAPRALLGDDLPAEGPFLDEMLAERERMDETCEVPERVADAALARDPLGRFCLLDGRIVRRGDEPLVRLAFSSSAAAFDEAGARLLLGDGDRLRVVPLDGGPTAAFAFRPAGSASDAS